MYDTCKPRNTPKQDDAPPSTGFIWWRYHGGMRASTASSAECRASDSSSSPPSASSVPLLPAPSLSATEKEVIDDRSGRMEEDSSSIGSSDNARQRTWLGANAQDCMRRPVVGAERWPRRIHASRAVRKYVCVYTGSVVGVFKWGIEMCLLMIRTCVIHTGNCACIPVRTAGYLAIFERDDRTRGQPPGQATSGGGTWVGTVAAASCLGCDHGVGRRRWLLRPWERVERGGGTLLSLLPLPPVSKTKRGAPSFPGVGEGAIAVVVCDGWIRIVRGLFDWTWVRGDMRNRRKTHALDRNGAIYRAMIEKSLHSRFERTFGRWNGP